MLICASNVKIRGNPALPQLRCISGKLVHKRKLFYISLRRKGLIPRKVDKYVKFDREVDDAIQVAYVNYLNKLFDNPDNPQEGRKRFYRFCKSQRKDQFGVPPLKHNGSLVCDAQEKADLLNNHLASVFTHEDLSSIPDLGKSPHPNMPKITITTGGIIKLLRSLNVAKAAGPGNIPTFLLKELAADIAPVIQSFFQQSLNEGRVPDAFKSANVSPVFKKGSHADVGNYRPISLTSVLCKCLEHIITKNLMCHLERNNILRILES